MKIKESDRKNSFFRFGGMEILSIEQDALSLLWKIKLATSEHYVVSKEFDRTKGMYANAPDDIVRIGLMDYSNSLIGNEMSIYDVMSSFIDRCFDDRVFGSYTSNAAWLCMDFPHYEEIEEMLSMYDARLVWDLNSNTQYMLSLNAAINKYFKPDDEDKCVDGLLEEFREREIATIFLNEDQKCEKLLKNCKFENISVFKGKYSENEEFKGFQNVRG